MMIGMYRRGTRRPHLGLRFVLAFCLKCPDAGHITASPAHKSYFLTS